MWGKRSTYLVPPQHMYVRSLNLYVIYGRILENNKYYLSRTRDIINGDDIAKKRCSTQ